MASFTAVGNSVELTVAGLGEELLVNLSGTYSMTIALQEKLGSGFAWDTIKEWSTANATVAETFTTRRQNATYRLIVTVDTSGTCTATLTSPSDRLIKTFGIEGKSDPVELYEGGFKMGSTGFYGPEPVTLTASATMTPREHAGRPILLSAAAGLTASLPAAAATGNIYSFFVITTVTSNDYTIAANGTDVLIGNYFMANDTDASVSGFEAGATDDKLVLNGTTTGGLKGDMAVFRDLQSGIWHVSYFGSGTGSEATPGAAT